MLSATVWVARCADHTMVFRAIENLPSTGLLKHRKDERFGESAF